jgi:hypothetical protein
MPRVLRFRNFAVYVADARDEQHHSPHCHVKERGRRIASIHIISLVTLKQIAPIPGELMDLIRESQDALLAEWERLNS